MHPTIRVQDETATDSFQSKTMTHRDEQDKQDSNPEDCQIRVFILSILFIPVK